MDKYYNIAVGDIHYTDLILDTIYKELVFSFIESSIEYQMKLKKLRIVT